MPTRATEGPVESESGLGPAARQVAEHASALARLEMELATVELRQKAAALGAGAGLVVAAAVFALFMLGFALAAVAAGLAEAMPTWLALVIVAGALLLLVVLLALLARRSIRRGTPPLPQQAIEEARLTTEAVRSNGGS